ncbi:BON domain-containing protein [Lysobacter enzymogenes]|uniref:BON domain-containing protein n=1 Tax=Lysobacter enzymogenes TaxID=69 RepID=UPI00384BD6E4
MTRLLTHVLAFAAGSVAAACLLDSRRKARLASVAAAERYGDDASTAQFAGAASDSDDDDRRLAAAVRAGLERDGFGESVDVQAEQGRIVATGRVADARRDAALRAIRAVPGVREVHDHLQPSERAQAAPGEPRLQPVGPSRGMEP